MNGYNGPQWKHTADAALQKAAYNPKRLVLLYSGISAALLLTATLINFLLRNQIANTGGLGGMGLRSILSTVSSVITLGVNAALPFWTLGFLASLMHLAKAEPFSGTSLLEGFRHFGPALRLLLLKQLLLTVPGIVCLYPIVTVFMLTPFARPLMDALAPLLSQTTDMNVLLSDPTVLAAVEQIIPTLLLFFAAVYLLLCIPLWYRLRLAELAVLEQPQKGAIAAIRKSVELTRRGCLKLLRLDLSFWWYYLLSGGILLLGYADTVAGAAGFPLPVSADAAFLICYILSLAAQLALSLWQENRVQLTYIVFYYARQGKTLPPVNREQL